MTFTIMQKWGREMLTYHEFPICEYDTERKAIINAEGFLEKTLPERCVITFFRKELEQLAREQNMEIVGNLHSEIVDIPIYQWEYKGERICITMPFATAPGAAGTIEELRAMGCCKFIVCGGAGCIAENMNLGEIILPVAALRDEGTSYHYLKPAREVECDKVALETVERKLREMGVQYRKGKTWTTDAFYRETADMIKHRKEEGCITVEMETAAFFAVAQYYDLRLAQLLYAGDDVSGTQWDSRGWNRQKGVRANLISIAIELVCDL